MSVTRAKSLNFFTPEIFQCSGVDRLRRLILYGARELRWWYPDTHTQAARWRTLLAAKDYPPVAQCLHLSIDNVRKPAMGALWR
jgi:hypothetical protein